MASAEQATAAPPGNGREAHGGPQMPRLPLPRMPIEMPVGPAGRALWWGGLAAVAAVGVVEWPVAVLVGAGSWVAEQYAKADTAQQAMRVAHDQQAPGHMPPQA
jgi:hypothetical protein